MLSMTSSVGSVLLQQCVTFKNTSHETRTTLVMSASQWRLLVTLLKRKREAKCKSFWGKSGSKIIGEVCWLNGVEFRVIDFEMTPKKTAFEFAESAEFRGFWFLMLPFSFFFFKFLDGFIKKRILFSQSCNLHYVKPLRAIILVSSEAMFAGYSTKMRNFLTGE